MAAGQAGEPTKVVITPEMISSAARSLVLFDPEYSRAEQWAEQLLERALAVAGYRAEFRAENGRHP